jgi:hypothetical protein
VSDWAGMLKSSPDRETVVAGVRNLAGEPNQARREVAGEARRREVIPRPLLADRLARADGQAIVGRSEAAEWRERWARPPPSLR